MGDDIQKDPINAFKDETNNSIRSGNGVVVIPTYLMGVREESVN
jgi:hypothetical protein